MIGVVRKDGCRPEQLLGQHCADQKVRPGRRSEADQQIGLGSNLILMPVRGADQKARLALTAIAPGFELPRKLNRGQVLPASDENNLDAVGDADGNRATTVGQLRQLRAPRDALQITVDQISLRRAAGLSPGDDVEEHYCVLKAGVGVHSQR